MGKRRDRRIAAQMAAGRRVKLDLFTEPSGDLVGASRHDEVGGDLDQDSHARAPNSPSSPGGFRQIFFKRIYTEDMPTQHICGGIWKFYKTILFSPRICVETVGWLSWEHSMVRSDRADTVKIE